MVEKKEVVATYDEIMAVTGYPGGARIIGAEWVCKVSGCTSVRKTGFAMMMHLKHDHEIQTQNLEIEEHRLVLKTETATDAGPETQKGNT